MALPEKPCENGSWTLHPDIQVRAVKAEGVELTVILAGQIRHHAIACLQEFLLAQFHAHEPRRFVLDFSSVSFLDSQGLGLLICLHQTVQPQGCALAITGASPHIRSLLELTRLNTFIQVV
jgi:anti-anti-sigma factor